MQEKPYGLWESPITAESLARGSLTVESHLAFHGRELYFVERRPDVGCGAAKEVLVALDLDNGNVRDVLAPQYGVRCLVHEYGGAAFAVCDKGVIFSASGSGDVIFYDGADYRVLLSGEAGRRRFGDFCYDERRRGWLAVAEIHEGESTPVNQLWFIGMDGTACVVASGADFYAAPCISFDGKHCAWLQWDLPYMAWDRAALWQAETGTNIKDGLKNARCVAGGTAGQSCFQPQYDDKGNLFYICDNGEEGFWQLHSLSADGAVSDYALRDEGVWVECGLPLWQLGMRVYDFISDDKILLAGCRLGAWGLYLLDINDGVWRKLSGDYCGFDGLRCYDGRGYFLASHPIESQALVELEINYNGGANNDYRVLRSVREEGYSAAYISRGRAICFSVGEAGDDGTEAYGYYYAPCNGDFTGVGGELPPLIMRCHGGPTAATGLGFNGKIQFWTSRGFAVCDLNYRGSTGYGRAFRESLYGHWGLYDPADCAAAARYLVECGLADGERLIISGSSAGGFSVLCALAFSDVFALGCSSYGIGDLAILAEDTHKFESRYLDMLVAPYPQGADIYRERSPFYSAHRIRCPVLFLQGSEDRVVPSNQMFAMVEALRKNGVRCEYVLFEGEGHGFRNSENIVRAYESELDFYLSVVIAC